MLCCIGVFFWGEEGCWLGCGDIFVIGFCKFVFIEKELGGYLLGKV